MHEGIERGFFLRSVADNSGLAPVLTWLRLLGEGYERENSHQSHILGLFQAELAREFRVEIADAIPESIDHPGFVRAPL